MMRIVVAEAAGILPVSVTPTVMVEAAGILPISVTPTVMVETVGILPISVTPMVATEVVPVTIPPFVVIHAACATVTIVTIAIVWPQQCLAMILLAFRVHFVVVFAHRAAKVPGIGIAVGLHLVEYLTEALARLPHRRNVAPAHRDLAIPLDLRRDHRARD